MTDEKILQLMKQAGLNPEDYVKEPRGVCAIYRLKNPRTIYDTKPQ
jgi:hypothetical protein